MTEVTAFCADDLSWELLAQADTPHIDSLFAGGTVFTNFWAGPKCSKSRAEAMTMRLPRRDENRVGDLLGPASTYDLPVDTPALLPKLALGSASFHGKHHLCGAGENLHPLQVGWDYMTGTLHNLGPAGGNYFAFPALVDGESVAVEEYATRWVADAAIVGELRGDNLVYVSFHAPHAPYHNPPEDYGLPHAKTKLKKALRMIEAMDFEVGRVMAADPRRVFVFFSDNGASTKIGGEKGELTERGINVPCAVYGPTQGVQEQDRADLCTVRDLSATIVELTGGSLPDGLDAVSLQPALFGDAYEGNTYAYTEAWSKDIWDFGVVPPLDEMAWAIRDSRWKIIAHPAASGVGDEFYDLLNDMDEENDLLLGQLTGEQQAAYDTLKASRP